MDDLPDDPHAPARPRAPWRRRAVGILAAAAVLVACSDDGPTLSAAGERGRSIANSNGCASCHGSNGQGGSGPKWVGLAGSEVELRDGSTVIADDDYLIRAIVDPSADLLADYDLQMPRNDLTDEQVADVIAYIEDLSAPPG